MTILGKKPRTFHCLCLLNTQLVLFLIKHDLPGRQQIWASGRSFFSMTFVDYHEKNHYVITSSCTFFRNHKNVLKKRDFLWSETKLFKSAPLYLSLALSFLAGIALLDIISWNLLSCGSYICDTLPTCTYKTWVDEEKQSSSFQLPFPRLDKKNCPPVVLKSF